MNELLAFEAAAKHGSFTDAAFELSLTTSAVSKQVGSLEDRLGHRLFQRSGRRLVLTETGHIYATRIRAALSAIESASIELLSSKVGTSTLNISVLPTFAMKWLIPRLAQFHQAHPGIMLNLQPHLRGSEGMPPQIDAAIRFGTGTWPGCRCDYLLGSELVAVGPSTANRGLHALRDPADLLRQTLLHHVAVPTAWNEWFTKAQVPMPRLLTGPRFEQYSMMIQAVTAGLGFAVIPAAFVEEEVARGQLAVLFGLRVSTEQGYYLVWPEERGDSASFHAFHAWVRSIARQSVTV